MKKTGPRSKSEARRLSQVLSETDKVKLVEGLVGEKQVLRQEILELCTAINLWAGRPTKDGAKKLRELASEIEARISEQD